MGSSSEQQLGVKFSSMQCVEIRIISYLIPTKTDFM